MLQQTVAIDESVQHSFLRRKMLGAGLGALMIETDNFEKNIDLCD
jgi:hypothetical protein